jgi:mono/diheme cytochrome c family protein
MCLMLRLIRSCLLAAAALATGCGGRDNATPEAGSAGSAATAQVTPFQLEHGIGPVTSPVSVGPLDQAMAAQGKALFEAKCSACHKMTERYVGPPLGEVTVRRTPAFIMNQVLNPEGMYTKHPVVKQLLADYMTQMPNLALTQEQARQIVEYLRTQASRTPEEKDHDAHQ